MDPTIIFQDEDLLVIDKPAGITVNSSDTTRGERTIQDWVENKLKIKREKLKADEENDFYNRAGIVHRIDKETSGILLIAKTPFAFTELQRQFKERVIKKSYLALVHGRMAPKEGEIRVPVARLPWNRKQFGIVAGGKEAITRYKVLFYYRFISSSEKQIAKLHLVHEQLSLVELYPETGRTHQIRVHLKYMHHPIFADFLYAGRKTSRADRKLLNRVFLHAAKITFIHPTTKISVTYTTKLPQELQNFIDTYLQEVV